MQNEIDENESDEISKPSHYCEGRKYEPKDVIRDWDCSVKKRKVILIKIRGKMKVLLEKVKYFFRTIYVVLFTEAKNRYEVYEEEIKENNL